MRPWRSPAARRRWELEGSVERRSRRRGSGVQRTEVTKGERDDDVEEDWVGGGIGMLTTSCIERASRTEMELPEGNARRPERLRSADPKLLRLGGPGSMLSQQSWTVDAVEALALDIVALCPTFFVYRCDFKHIDISDTQREQRSVFSSLFYIYKYL
ncbi:hypothetical protein ACFX11_026419 [Malus domestica]